MLPLEALDGCGRPFACADQWSASQWSDCTSGCGDLVHRWRYGRNLPQNEHESPRLLTVREVAHRLGVSPHTLYRAIAAGHLRGVRLGESPSAPIRVYEADLERFLRPTTTRVIA